jgi:hypothetical protein
LRRSLLLTLASCVFDSLEPGECETDGARTCEHVPGCTDTYLPDTGSPLAAEYWRVFETEDGQAYLFPRPDGSPFLDEACAGELREILDRYTLCSEAPDVERVNAMDRADALAIARDQHERLLFTAEAERVEPWPFLDDLAAICASSPEPGLDEVCAALPQGDTCTDEARTFTAEQASLLAAALNERYGITP